MKAPCLLAAIIALCLLLSLATAASERAEAVKLVIPVFFQSNIPKDFHLISEAVDRLAKEKIGASAECIPLLHISKAPSASKQRVAEFELLRKQGIEFDIVIDGLPYAQFAAIDDYLPQYGTGILELVGEDRLDFSRIDGKVRKLPSVSDYVASVGVAMRKDIAEKYGIDANSIRSLSDLDRALELVSANEPRLKLICPYQTRDSFMRRLHLFSAISTIFDFPSGDVGSVVANYYATDEYKSYIGLFRKWHDQGYLPDNMALQNIRASQLVGAGELFAYFTSYKPDIDYEESVACGRNMITASIKEPMVTRQSQGITYWGVSEICARPDKAVQFLNLLYCDSELVNLLAYGIEGIHYAKKPDGTIGYPDGVEAGSAGYVNDESWILPNQLIEHVWQGSDPLLREKMRAYNDSAQKSDSLYFRLDSSGMAPELDALGRIADQYAYGLETGQLAPETYLPMMLDELDGAGIDGVISKIQAQYDRYLYEKNGAGDSG